MDRNLKKITAFLCCGLLTLSAACGCKGDIYNDAGTETTVVETTSPLIIPKSTPLSCPYYDRNSFSVHTADAADYEYNGEIFCGTIPHHLLAGRLIAGFLEAAASSRKQTDTVTDTVIVTATMHFTEDDPICTSLCDWDTPFGKLECDTVLTGAIMEETGAVCDDDMAMLDHGISALVPYIKYYFPDSEIAFVLVDNMADKDIPERLARLYASFDKDCLFLFSADFSHYLPAHDTEKHDLETIEAVAEMDYGKVAAMTDDNVDSPYVLGTFMHLAENCGAKPTLLGRSNSMLISGVPYSEKAYPEGLTSYQVYCGEK